MSGLLYIEETCSVCTGDFGIERKVHSIVCGHVFCRECLDCIDPRVCPVCRKPFEEVDVECIGPWEEEPRLRSIDEAGPVPTTKDSDVYHHTARCDVCGSSIVGSRFKCLNCPDWDACASCVATIGVQHPGHGFVEVKDPIALTQYPNTLGSSSIIHNAFCNACTMVIRGVRYKCMHPLCADYDLCERCEALPHLVHPPTHAFLKLRSPEVPVSIFLRSVG